MGNVREKLERDFGILHKPLRRRFPSQRMPVMVFGIDELMSGGSDRSEDAKDAGKEIYNKHFQALMEQKNIHHSH